MTADDQPAMQSTADAVRMVSAAIAASDFRQASGLADHALEQGFIHPAFYNARALWLERQERNEDALTEFRRARALAPADWAVLNAIGLCLTRLYRLDEAIESFDEAIRINPAYAPSYQRKGVALGMAGRPKAAGDSYRRALSLDPRNVEALASMASITARNGDAATAERHAGRAMALDPSNATAHAAMALLELSRGQFTAAESRLLPLLDDAQLAGHGRSVVLGLLGDALDGQSRYAEAFAAYEAGNRELRKVHAPRFDGKPTMSGMLEQLTGRFADIPDARWNWSNETDPVQPARLHVFLLGFYRSGTTLLEQALESHPDVVTLEERDCLAEAAERYLTSADGLDRLLQLEGMDLENTRAAYWRAVGKHGIRCEDKVFVDKHPLNTAKLPLIRKLFPTARILFALRDPRDVVLSCFRRHFEINATMFEFLTLGGTATLYDRVMAFAEICRRKIPFEIHQLRYEDLVSDFEGRTRSVCDFLGLDYSERMLNFAETARGLDIRSPSVQQVRRGLYTESLGQWRRYEEQLAPVLPVLAPWVERFDYGAA